MNPLTSPVTFTSSLTAEFKRQALVFSREQQNPQKARQVYLNTLAIQAVNFYCQCIGVKTDLTASDSWNPTLRTLMNVADLVIPEIGKLECLPVLPDDDVCLVPPEVQEERLGYVVVTIDEVASEARIQGFSATAETGKLSVSRLDSLSGLINALITDPLEKASSPLLSASIGTHLISLGEWFQDISSELWHPPELLLATSYRSALQPKESHEFPLRRNAKSLTLGNHQIALVVQVTKINATELDVLLKICPADSNILPPELLMQLFDDANQVVMQTETQQADNFRSLNFQIDRGERFEIKLTLQDTSITERFMS